MEDNWKVTKNDMLKMLIPLILISGYLIWRQLDHTTSAQLVLTDIKKVDFHGKVDSVYRDRWDHNTKKVKLTTGYIYGLYPEWEDKVGIGDSLSKQQDSVIVKVFKSNGTQISLDYRVLVSHFRK
jgi:hypothetical protein